jgi:hypothetical protein
VLSSSDCPESLSGSLRASQSWSLFPDACAPLITMDLSISRQPIVIEPGLDAAIDPLLEAELKIIRTYGPIQLAQVAQDIIPSSQMPPLEFLHALSEVERTDVFRACLLVFKLSRGAVVPRVFQLQAALASLAGQDSVIVAGTGSGKTLCIIIPLLLRPAVIGITVSPLKRLQITQVRKAN